jgi:hypothetical protein
MLLPEPNRQEAVRALIVLLERAAGTTVQVVGGDGDAAA